MNNTSYKHNREIDISESCLDLRMTIDDFSNSRCSEILAWYFKTFYSLPKEVTKRQMCIFLEGSYHYENASFANTLKISRTPLYFLKFIFYFFVIFFKSKLFHHKKNHTLIIDSIFHQGELDRFGKLIDMYPPGEVGIIASEEGISFQNTTTYYRPNYKFYDFFLVIKTTFIELLIGLPTLVILSCFKRVNYIALSLNIINQYLYYSSIFKYIKCRFVIQEKHYRSSALKTFLFKKYGGELSTTFQKNIYQFGRNGFYYDFDVIFSLGTRTLEECKNYGAKIDKVIPIGSVFMEYLWFKTPTPFHKKLDILFVGINASTGMYYVNSYDSFKKDYYESFQWIAQYSKENPHLKISIKHHPSLRKIDREEKLAIQGSNIEYADLKENTYQMAFNSNAVITFASTMGIELLAHGIPSIYLDPGHRCAFLPKEDFERTENMRASTYQEFKILLDKALNSKKFFDDIETDSFCLPSDNASKRIFDYFEKY
ncbi:hypothetical protein OAT67_06250 [Bacteriovoracaceae bacterium]|nr:hypothetical protein [Bacteriovoracaceae bacterium]